MIKVYFIGEINQTNSLISDSLVASGDIDITFTSPVEVFSNLSNQDISDADIIITDLNTCKGFGSAPVKIQKLRSAADNTPILVLANHENEVLQKPLIEAGAAAILTIAPSESELLQTFTEILESRDHSPE